MTTIFKDTKRDDYGVKHEIIVTCEGVVDSDDSDDGCRGYVYCYQEAVDGELRRETNFHHSKALNGLEVVERIRSIHNA